jgi:hypothetical protein
MPDPVRELVIKVSVDADTDDLKKVAKDQDEAKTKSVALGTALGALTADLVKMGAAAAKAAVEGLAALVFETAELGDEIGKTSQKLGVSADQLQRLRGAAELSGAAAEDITGAIKDLGKNLSEGIEKGAGPAVEALATLGLEVAEVDAILADGDIEGALGLIGDAMNESTDSMRANAAAAKLLGGAGEQLGPLLRAGSAGIREMGDTIEATGVVIDKDGIEKFAQMQDAQLLLDKQMQAAKNTIAVGLAPAVGEIGDKVSAWISENDQVISQDLPAVLAAIADAAVSLVTGTLELISTWREFSRDVGNLIEIITEDLDPALDGVEGAFSSIGAAISGASLAALDLVDSFLEAVGAGEELRQIFKEIRGDIAGDTGTQGTRGAPGFAGGGSALVDPRFEKAAEASGDTTKLKQIAADPKFTDADRARAEAKAATIDERQAQKAAEEQSRVSRKRSDDIQASRARARTAQRQQARALRRAAPRTGGGGGPAEPSVEDLIGLAGAPGGASPAALRSASSALSGTLLVTTDNRVQISNTVEVGGVTVSATLPTEVGPETAAAIGGVVNTELARQNREAFDLAKSRNNVGFT